MTDCVPDASGRRCLHCKWKQNRGRVFVRHKCLADEPETAAARLLAELQQDAADGSALRSLDEMRATVEACFSGCPQLADNVCTRWGSGCERREAWLSKIRTTGCDRERMRDEG